MAVITCFAADFAPRYWASCNGQILPIAQNQALFSLLGTTYGGNGISTFGLPDLRGRTPVSQGQSITGTVYTLGESTGQESVTLSANNLPSHVHNGPIQLKLQADNTGATDTSPDFNYNSLYTNSYAPTANAAMLAPTYSVTIGTAGSSIPVNIRDPYLAVNYIICLNGIFPSRN